MILAELVLQSCLDEGVRDFCVCAGSRNSDLVHLLFQWRARDPQLRLFAFSEERSAAFFALGQMQAQRADGPPSAVITTSGTAAAELFPAVIEAHYQARSLLVITADRPKRFRGSGSPQAIDQRHLFGSYANFHDIEDVGEVRAWREGYRRGPSCGPIHLNVCLEEPGEVAPALSGDGHGSATEPITTVRETSLNTSSLEAFLKERSGSLMVMAGCLQSTDSLVEALRTLGVPILADATSGLHGVKSLHDQLVRGGDRAIRQWDFSRILRIGGVPSFRAWRDLEARGDVGVFSLSSRPFTGLARSSQLLVGPEGELLSRAVFGPQEAPVGWQNTERASADRLDALLKAYPRSEPALLRDLASRIAADAKVFLGNSLPIRELALVAARAMPWTACANRGANGIDGNLSAFLGAASRWAAGEAWGVFGDLTTLYDLGALAILEQMPALPLRLVVVNNQGGKIFRRLPNFQGLADADAAFVENRHGFDFAAWAASWGVPYQTFETLSSDLPERVVIELRPAPEETEAFWEAWQV